MKQSGHTLYFKRIDNKEKIAALKKQIAARSPEKKLKTHLKSIRRVIIEERLSDGFGELAKVLRASEHFRRHYANACYKYEDVNGDPHLITGEKAVEEVFRDVISKDSQLYVLTGLLEDVKSRISERYNSTRAEEPDGSVRVNLAMLGSEFLLHLEAALFLMKSTTELYASFVQFLYPPMQQAPPARMRKQITYFSGAIGQALDPIYSQHLSKQMGWFYRLKSLRDATAHFGNFVFAMEETMNGNRVIAMYPRRSHMVEERILYQEIHGLMYSYSAFIEFYRAHFIRRLLDGEGKAQA